MTFFWRLYGRKHLFANNIIFHFCIHSIERFFIDHFTFITVKISVQSSNCAINIFIQKNIKSSLTYVAPKNISQQICRYPQLSVILTPINPLTSQNTCKSCYSTFRIQSIFICGKFDNNLKAVTTSYLHSIGARQGLFQQSSYKILGIRNCIPRGWIGFTLWLKFYPSAEAVIVGHSPIIVQTRLTTLLIVLKLG